MIDLKNGGILLNNNKKLIRKGLTKNEFENSSLYRDLLDYQTYGFTSYFVKPQLIGDDKFTLSYILTLII